MATVKPFSIRMNAFTNCLLAIIFLAGIAQGAEMNNHQPASEFDRSIPKVSAQPKIDGTLDDPCWQSALKVDLMDATTGRTTKAPTTAYVCYDAKNIYIAFDCKEPFMDKLKANVKDRNGEIWNDDCVEVFIDPGLSQKNYYHFMVNTLNTQGNEKCNGVLNPEKGWDGHWKSSTRVSLYGWTVEMKIPFSNFDLAANTGTSWGINLCRERKVEPENSTWAPVEGVFHSPEKFGIISNLNIGYTAVSQPALNYLIRNGKLSLTCTQTLTNCTEGSRKLTVKIKNLNGNGGATKTINFAKGETKNISFALDIRRYTEEYKLWTEVTDSTTGDITYSSVKTITPTVIQAHFNRACYVKEKTAHLIGAINTKSELPAGLCISILLQTLGMPPIAKRVAISGRKIDIPVDISSVPAGNHNVSVSMTRGTEVLCTQTTRLTKLPSLIQETERRISSMHRELTIYVSPNGKDTNDGLAKEKPLKTLQAARSKVRQAIKKCKNSSITVVLAGGIYEIPETFELTAEDNGLPNLPVIWRAADGERAILSGGKQLTGAITVPITQTNMYSRIPAEVRDKVICYDLKAVDISNLGTIAQRGGFSPVATSHVELFYKGIRQPFASYPQAGYEKIFALTDNAVKFAEHETTRTSSLGEFSYGNDKISTWKNCDGMFMHGYWAWDWADGYKQILSVDKQNKVIRCTPGDKPNSLMSIRVTGRYRILNVPEELREPGQFVMDFKQAKIYFLPPKGFNQKELYISTLDKPIVKLNGAAYITMQGIELAYTRSAAVECNYSKDITLQNLKIYAAGNNGLNIAGGSGVRVDSCDISGTGDGCIRVAGGDRETLSPAGHSVTNCKLHDFGQWSRTMHCGIWVSGCGIRLAGNEICNAPHAGIMYWGNDMLIENNIIHDIATETNDVGAIYCGRDWTFKGNVVRYNHIYDVGISGKKTCEGIYLDDFLCGQQVYGNVVEGCVRGVLIGAGQDNIIEDNVFIECTDGISIDARGRSWAKSYFDGRYTWLHDRLKDHDYQNPPFSVRYPELPEFEHRVMDWPSGNRINNNYFEKCARYLEFFDGVKSDDIEFAGNIISH